ncbi:MAG: hypothetical protein EBR67_09805 [Proteobacteria bacterium]|nr:hypothetical protein [Pseudomonadota bacterium]
MKLKLKESAEQVELIKAMGSRDANVAREASEAFAAFIGPVIEKVLMEAGTASMVYTDLPFDEDDSPSIPLDLWNSEKEGYVNVWSQNVAGGLPTSTVEGFAEMKVSTYRLDSAVSFLKRYARRGRLDVVSKALERMSNEVLVKQERNAWAVVLKALASANNIVTTGNTANATSSTPRKSLELSHLNDLLTLIKRINTSYAGGTTNSTYGVTDLFVSPEVKGDIRGFSYSALGGSSAGKGATDLPQGVREEIFRGAGAQEVFGITLHELVELGRGAKYNQLFDGLGASNFDAATDEVLVALDLSKDAFVRPVARQSETGGTFTALPDDQFVTRSEKIGFYGSLEEGRVALDGRAVGGIILRA